MHFHIWSKKEYRAGARRPALSHFSVSGVLSVNVKITQLLSADGRSWFLRYFAMHDVASRKTSRNAKPCQVAVYALTVTAGVAGYPHPLSHTWLSLWPLPSVIIRNFYTTFRVFQQHCPHEGKFSVSLFIKLCVLMFLRLVCRVARRVLKLSRRTAEV